LFGLVLTRNDQFEILLELFEIRLTDDGKSVVPDERMLGKKSSSRDNFVFSRLQCVAEVNLPLAPPYKFLYFFESDLLTCVS
jgi:hypothetical protein